MEDGPGMGRYQNPRPQIRMQVLHSRQFVHGSDIGDGIHTNH